MDCKNCERPLRSDYSFCSNCGAKIIRNRLTLKNLWFDVTERYFNVDNTFLKTVGHLFSKPEVVIGGYIDGIRKKYLNPISYYAIAVTLTGLLFFLIKEFFHEQLSMEWINPAAKNQGVDTFDATIKYQSIISVVSIPLYALLSKIIFLKNKKMNFTEHIVIYLYLFAQYTIVSFPLMLLGLVLGGNYMALVYIGIALQLIYVAYSLKRIFRLSMKQILWKTLLFMLLLFFLFVATTIGYILITYLTGGVEALKAMGNAN